MKWVCWFSIIPISIIHHNPSCWWLFHYSIITMLIFWCFTSGDVLIWLDLSTGWSLFFFVIHKAPNDWGCRCFSLQKIFMPMVGSTASGLPWKAKNCQVMHQRSRLKIDSRTDYQKLNQWFRDIVGLETKVCPEIVCRILAACLVTIQAMKPKARWPVQVLVFRTTALQLWI